MTRQQYERDQLRLAREKHLQLLASAEQNAQPLYVIGAAGYWLARWGGKRHPTRGRSRGTKTIKPAPAAQDAAGQVERRLILDYVNNWRKRIRECSTPASSSRNSTAGSLDFSLST